MGDMLRNILDGSRPIDWIMLVIETLVLLLIFYEVFVGARHRRTEQKRQLGIRQRLSELSQFMDKGHQVQVVVPDPDNSTPLAIGEWIDEVQAWTEKTNAYLVLYSPRASAAFLLITNAGKADSVVFSKGRYFALRGPLREHYQRLIAQMENLRGIMERPEAYF